MRLHCKLRRLAYDAQVSFHRYGGPQMLCLQLGIPNWPHDLVRTAFFNEFLGAGHVQSFRIRARELGLRLGIPRCAYDQPALILVVEDFPGRIRGFFIITEEGGQYYPEQHLIHHPGKDLILLRVRPIERWKQYASLQDAFTDGRMYAELGMDINMGCCPCLST